MAEDLSDLAAELDPANDEADTDAPDDTGDCPAQDHPATPEEAGLG